MKKIIKVVKKIYSNQVVKWFLLAFVLALFCDILNQRSIIEAIVRLFTKPLNFIFNLILIMITISLSGLFKHRKFALTMCCAPWIVLAVTNFIVQCFRNTPFSFVDLSLVFSVFSVFNNYLSIFEMVLIVLAIIGAITGLVILYKKENKSERLLRHSIITALATILIALVIRFPLITVGALSDDYSNLTNAYREYGLPYCFVVSVVDRNVDKPAEYNKELVEQSLIQLEELMKQLDKKPGSNITVNSEQKPNVIFLQLESFMDPNYILNLEFSENPTPFFTYLKENYPSGTLTVPSFGAGTANVEFEIMTGLNLNFFGAGEYPYTTVMQKQSTETIAYNLKENGYFSTVIHNNRATFYNRDDVFKNMGYDRFVSSEFIINLEYTQVGWAKDECLTYEIMKALKTSEESDFIYTISVQPHGQYIDSFDKIKDIYMSAQFNDGTKDEELLAQYTYYINQLYEVDLFLKDLTDQLSNHSEPTMLVLYGDHLPNFDFEDEDLYLQDKYKSEYVIWTNYDTDLEDKDLYTYTLSSYILENIGCTNGIINKLHQTRELNDKFLEMYQLFEYDIFSNDKYLWNGKNPYQQLETQLGYDDVTITNITFEGAAMIVHGENFTLSSKVYFGNDKQDTLYKDSNTLIVQIDDLDDITKISVKQVSSKNVIYSTSNIIEYNQNTKSIG